MLGDFNEVLCREDKFGGDQVKLNRVLEFKGCLDECNMLDLGFAGSSSLGQTAGPFQI